MPLDPSAVGSSSEPYRATWDHRAALLYAVAIGAGTDELAFTTENTTGVAPQVFPTFAVVVGHGQLSKRPAFGSYNPTRTFHSGQSLTLHQALPAEGDVTIEHSVAEMYDKGQAAIVVLESTATDARTGSPMFTRRSSLFDRDGGGWGGQDAPPRARAAQARNPDYEVTYVTSQNQALLYRLAIGDRSGLHSDPALARAAGFDRPTLHGLCTFGFAARALLHTCCDGDSSRFVHVESRLRRPVFPGDSLKVRIWLQGAGKAVFETVVDDRVVMDDGLFRFC